MASDDLNNILNSSDLPIVVLDRALRIRFFTPAITPLFDVTASDIGRPLGELTHRFRADDILSDVHAVFDTVAPIRREVETDDGTCYICGVRPYRSDEKHVDGVLITFVDISEVKVVQRESQSARAYSEGIIATIEQPLVVLDTELRVVSASTSFYRVFEIEPATIVGRHLLDFGSHLDVPEMQKYLAALLSSGAGVADTEITLTLPTCGVRSFMVSARAIGDSPLGNLNVLLSIVDVTDAKRESKALAAAKALAENANIGKSRFLAAASHDLRQPLQTINLLQGILKKRARDEHTLQLLERLDDTVGAMSSMLDKLLDINQLEAGVVQPNIVNFPISSLLARLKADFAYLAEEKGLQWHVVPCSLVARSDPKLLGQMLHNLISNAVKYTSKGKLLLGCRRREGIIRIEVLDTGIGLPMEQARKIFDEFHQLANPARDSSLGLGLGLSIVKRIGDLLGHSIDVRSIPGYGSAFAVEVRIGDAGEGGETRPIRAVQENSVPVVGTILIIDDDPIVRNMIKMLLDQEGHRATVAGDVATALDIAGKDATELDLVIADYNLSCGASGLEAIAGLRQQLGRDIPAIVLTGDIATITLRAVADQGHIQLNKPVKSQQLISLIQHLLVKATKNRPDAATDVPSSADPSAVQRVFVVDDDAVVLRAMRDLLHEHGYAVEIFTNGEEFLHAERSDGCLLIDARLPGMTGLELIERLRAENCTLPTVMITGDGDIALAVEAMKAGASDFIQKPVGHVELLASIARAFELDGGRPSAAREQAISLVAGLTARQRQIMDLVMAGHPSKNIAADLGISQRTVDNHRAAIMRKTGSKSLPALIRIAIAAA
ncbi:response regulator [Hyphomicrobium sp. CS1GBMeth3]|uniref:response regulator n=1 Tax=Hyphomicrobium sp. CS1GBMeth3 TaxID=1892845 RepID=UPI0015C55A7A|nr:response regulator [Hyphomicrobium sp. CS1GBMeth3]